MSLEEAHNLCETLVTHVLKHTKHTSTEENLGVAKPEVVFLHLECFQHILCHYLPITESLGDGIWSQDGVSEALHNVLGTCNLYDFNLLS